MTACNRRKRLQSLIARTFVLLLVFASMSRTFECRFTLQVGNFVNFTLGVKASEFRQFEFWR